MEKLKLSIPNLTLQVENGGPIQLSPQLFKVLYQLFKSGRKAGEHSIIYYNEFPIESHAALKVLFVDIKKMLPKGSYVNVRNEGYRPLGICQWELKI